jgi:hypothetical protein
MWIPDVEARSLATRLLAEVLDDVREVLDELDGRRFLLRRVYESMRVRRALSTRGVARSS